MFLQHCYHGSVVSGLSVEPDIRCEQLLDLYFMGQEYLCPSLSMECVMRLLSRDPFQCFCWNCCSKLERKNNELISCHYTSEGPSATLIAANLLGVIAQLEEWNHEQSGHIITVENKYGKERHYGLLELLWSATWMATLTQFPEIFKTNSYLSAMHSTIREYTEHGSSDQFECFGDEISVILLQNCIDALASGRG